MSVDDNACCLQSSYYLQPGSHVCYLYADDVERRAFLASWLGPWTDDGSAAAPPVAAILSRHGLGPETLVGCGILQAPPPLGLSLPGMASGPGAASRPPCLAIEAPPGDDAAMELHEAAVSALATTEGLAVLCLYDRRRFDDAVLLRAIERHPLVATAECVVANPHYLPPSTSSPAELLEARLQAIGELADLRARAEWNGELYERIFVNSPIGLEVFDGQGRLIDANSIAVGIRGAANVMSMRGRDLFGTPGLPRDARARLDAGESVHFETVTDAEKPRSVGTAGQVPTYYHVTVSYLHTTRGYLMQTVDVSDQRRMAENLKRQEALFRSLVERSPMVIYLGVVGQAGVQEYVSPQVEAMLGFTPEEWVSDLSIWRRQLHPDDSERVQAAENRLRRAECDFHEVYRFYARDGRIVWVDDRAGVVRDDQGRPIAYQGVMVDVTARQEAQDALRRSEARLRTMLQTTQEGFLLFDDRGRFLDANPAYSRMSGYTRDELLKLSVFDVDPSLGSSAMARMVEKWRIGGGEVFESRHRRKDGGLLDVSIAMTPMRDGDRWLLFAFVRDVTDLNRTVQALAQSEMRFRSLVENAPVVIYTADLKRPEAPPYVSPICEKMLGWPASAWSQPGFLQSILHPDDREAALAAWERLLAKGGTFAAENRIIAKDGRVVWVYDQASLVLDGDGRPHMVQGVMVDITEARVAQEALVASQRRFREVLNSLQMLSVALDAAGRVEYANPALLALTGLNWEDVAGGDWLDLFVPDEAARRAHFSVFQALLSGHSAAAASEYEIAARDGQHRLIRWSSTVLRDPAGSPLGMASIGEDITERRRIEEQLRQSQRLETVGRLAGGIAHDFNNLLTTVTGYSEFAQESLPPGSAAAHDIGEVLRAADRASDLTRQLLAFSRRQVMQPRILDLGALLLRLHEMLHGVVGPGIELVMRTDGPTWPVRVDPGQIEHVVVSLAENARDAMPNGGTLTIELTNSTVSPELATAYLDFVPGDYVLLTVGDNGAGMSEEVMAHLFEPFYTTKPTGKGTGLGLSTVYGTVKQHGGQVTVQSTPGDGTRFLIYLPRAVGEAAKADIRPRRQVLQTGSEALMVVEDEPSVRRVMTRVLTSAGYDVVEAASPVEAARLMEQHPGIDLLVTDVVMPQITGKALADKLRLDWPGLKVLFVSGYPQDEVGPEGSLATGMAFMRKPFTATDLTARVRAVLDGEKV